MTTAIEQAAEALRIIRNGETASPATVAARALARLTAEQSRIVHADMSDSADAGGGLTLGDIRNEIFGEAERAAVPPDRERPGRDAMEAAVTLEIIQSAVGRVTTRKIGSLIEEIVALRFDALRSPADGWRDIESAPKDGTEILGVNDDGIRCVIHWGKHNHVPLYGWIRPIELYGEEVDGFEPLSWAPLFPSPPAKEKTP